jgi:DNA-binding PadR family transcriptional regulator
MREEEDKQQHGRNRDHDHGQHHGPEQWRGHWMRNWMRHTAMVPKGFLRYQLLKMLLEKPMSGSEIMSELEADTNGYWKPSPGSIYPLLAWLQDQAYIKEADQKEPGIRRYILTEQGKSFLENEKKSREEIEKRLEQFGSMWYGFDRKGKGDARHTARNFGRVVRDVFHEIRREHSKESIEEAMKSLEEITERLQEMTTKLRDSSKESLEEVPQ